MPLPSLPNDLPREFIEEKLLDLDAIALVNKYFGPLKYIQAGELSAVFRGALKTKDSLEIPVAVKFFLKRSSRQLEFHQRRTMFESEIETLGIINDAEEKRNQDRPPQEHTHYFPKKYHLFDAAPGLEIERNERGMKDILPSNSVIIREFLDGMRFADLNTDTLSLKDKVDLLFQIIDALSLVEQAEVNLEEGLKDCLVEQKEGRSLHFFDLQRLGLRDDKARQRIVLSETRKKMVAGALSKLFNIYPDSDSIPGLKTLPRALKEIFLGVVLEDQGNPKKSSENFTKKYASAEAIARTLLELKKQILEKNLEEGPSREQKLNQRIADLIVSGEVKKFTHKANILSYTLQTQFSEFCDAVSKDIPLQDGSEKTTKEVLSSPTAQSLETWARDAEKVSRFCQDVRAFLNDIIPRIDEKNLEGVIRTVINSGLYVQSNLQIPPFFIPPEPLTSPRLSFLHAERKKDFQNRFSLRQDRNYRMEEQKAWRTEPNPSEWQRRYRTGILNSMAGLLQYMRQSTPESGFPAAAETMEKGIPEIAEFRKDFLALMQKTYTEDTADFREEIRWCEQKIAAKQKPEGAQLDEQEKAIQEYQERIESAWRILNGRVQEINRRLEQESFAPKIPTLDLAQITANVQNETLLSAQLILPHIHELLIQSISDFKIAQQEFNATADNSETKQKHFEQRKAEHGNFTNFLSTVYGLIETDEEEIRKLQKQLLAEKEKREEKKIPKDLEYYSLEQLQEHIALCGKEIEMIQKDVWERLRMAGIPDAGIQSPIPEFTFPHPALPETNKIIRIPGRVQTALESQKDKPKT